MIVQLDSPCPDRQQLLDFLQGALSSPEAGAALHNHLGQCDCCQTAVRGLARDCHPTHSIRPDTPAPQHYPFLLPAVQPDEIGRLGNYRVLRLLGAGGMAFVFLAEDIALRRPVALKVMNPALHGDLQGAQRFLREARLMAAIEHERLVSVYQVGQEAQAVYLAMELLQGETLGAWLARSGTPTVEQIVRLGREIAEGLAVLHTHGLMHRDIKPANLWVEPNGNIKLLDFGLARFIDDVSGLTETGMVMGTPGFVSPEQARGDKVDARSDLFSLGCVLYLLSTGEAPFQAPNTMAMLTALAVRFPRPVHEIRPDIPLPLSRLIDELLAKRPEDRPAPADAIVARLRHLEYAPSDPITPRQEPPVARHDNRRWPGPTCAAVLFSAAALLGGWFFWPGASPQEVPVAPRPQTTATEKKNAEPQPPVAPTVAPAVAVREYLSDFRPIHQEHWPFNPPRFPSPPGKGPPDGATPVRIGGQLSPHGIFVHPPAPPDAGQPVRISYRLGGRFHTFAAIVSLNDGPMRSNSPLTFSVLGDGRLLWRSQPVREQADAQLVTLPVAGVEILTLQVVCPGDIRGAHAVWVEPAVTR